MSVALPSHLFEYIYSQEKRKQFRKGMFVAYIANGWSDDVTLDEFVLKQIHDEYSHDIDVMSAIQNRIRTRYHPRNSPGY